MMIDFIFWIPFSAWSVAIGLFHCQTILLYNLQLMHLLLNILHIYIYVSVHCKFPTWPQDEEARCHEAAQVTERYCPERLIPIGGGLVHYVCVGLLSTFMWIGIICHMCAWNWWFISSCCIMHLLTNFFVDFFWEIVVCSEWCSFCLNCI